MLLLSSPTSSSHCLSMPIHISICIARGLRRTPSLCLSAGCVVEKEARIIVRSCMPLNATQRQRYITMMMMMRTHVIGIEERKKCEIEIYIYRSIVWICTYVFIIVDRFVCMFS